MGVSIKLPLSDEEKSQLRRVKVRVNELYTFDTEQIAQMLNISTQELKL